METLRQSKEKSKEAEEAAGVTQQRPVPSPHAPGSNWRGRGALGSHSRVHVSPQGGTPRRQEVPQRIGTGPQGFSGTLRQVKEKKRRI